MDTEQFLEHVLKRHLLEDGFLPELEAEERHIQQCQQASHEDCSWPGILAIPAGSLQACCDASQSEASRELIRKLAQKEIKLKVNYRYGLLEGSNGLDREEIPQNRKEQDRLLTLDNKDRIFRCFKDMYRENLKPRVEIPTEARIRLLLEHYINHHRDNANQSPKQGFALIDREKIASALSAPFLVKILKTKTTKIPLVTNRQTTEPGAQDDYAELSSRLFAISDLDLKPCIERAEAGKLRGELFDVYKPTIEKQFIETCLEGFKGDLEDYLEYGATPAIRRGWPGEEDPESLYDHIVDNLEECKDGRLAVEVYPERLPRGRVVLYRQLTQLRVRFGNLADCYLPGLKSIFKKDDLVQCIELRCLTQIDDTDLEFYPVADLPALLVSLNKIA